MPIVFLVTFAVMIFICVALGGVTGGLPITLVLGMFFPVIGMFLLVMAILFLALMGVAGHARTAVEILLGIVLAPVACIAVVYCVTQYSISRMNVEIGRMTTEEIPKLPSSIKTIGIDRQFFNEYVHPGQCNAICLRLLSSTDFQVEMSISDQKVRVLYSRSQDLAICEREENKHSLSDFTKNGYTAMCAVRDQTQSLPEAIILKSIEVSNLPELKAWSRYARDKYVLEISERVGGKTSRLALINQSKAGAPSAEDVLRKIIGHDLGQFRSTRPSN